MSMKNNTLRKVAFAAVLLPILGGVSVAQSKSADNSYESMLRQEYTQRLQIEESSNEALSRSLGWPSILISAVGGIYVSNLLRGKKS